MWGSATRRKEMKERRKGSRIFLFSKKVFGKVGLAARMKGEKTRSLKKGKRQKAEEEI